MTKRMNYNAASPAGMKAHGVVYGYVAQSGLPTRLIDLVYLRIAQINCCAYCIDMHARDVLTSVLPVEHLLLVQVWSEAGDLFDEKEKAALALAETVTRVADTGVLDEAYNAAVAAFGEKELSDLTVAIGLMNAHNRLAIGFRAMPRVIRI